MADHILTARKGHVLEIILNRPEIGNAASDAMAVELTKLLLGAGESSEIVVLRGAGEDFCVGRETMGKRPPGPPLEAFELRRRNDVVFNCYGAFRRCEVPVIGVVKGRAFGFGCAIAAVCDITLAAASEARARPGTRPTHGAGQTLNGASAAPNPASACPPRRHD